VPESKIKQKVYHGSDNIITGEFKNLNPNIVGYWFSSDIDNAKTYGKNVSSYYLDIKNPLVIDAKGLKFTDDIPVEVLSDYSSLDPSEKPKLITLPIGADEIVSMVKNGKKKNQLIEIPNREQYDGVVFKNFIDPSLTYRREVSQDTVVAFENSQIKKANNEFISEAYHKAKADGSNPELVKAVEEVLGEKLSEPLVEVEEVKGQSQPIEGDRIDLPPNVKGGMSREFVFNDGVWKQQVGGVVSAVGAKTQEQAQKAWDNKGKTMPQIEVTGVDAKLFDEIEKALSLIGSNNKQMALQDLHTGKNAKYTKEQVDKAIEIMANFDRITKDMEREGLLKKECKT
jgi:hypothetical protein